jgi:hypothetical protein
MRKRDTAVRRRKLPRSRNYLDRQAWLSFTEADNFRQAGARSLTPPPKPQGRRPLFIPEPPMHVAQSMPSGLDLKVGSGLRQSHAPERGQRNRPHNIRYLVSVARTHGLERKCFVPSGSILGHPI